MPLKYLGRHYQDTSVVLKNMNFVSTLRHSNLRPKLALFGKTVVINLVEVRCCDVVRINMHGCTYTHMSTHTHTDA